jgi:predicted HTH domain antitoxin
MSSINTLQTIAQNLPVFSTPEQKERLLFIIGALTTRIISLRKAAELMNLDTEVLLQILDSLGVQFSYLAPEDIERENIW